MRAAVLAFLVASTAVARAAPQVEIKAQTQLVLGRARITDTGTVEVAGKLEDKLTGDGLGGQRVRVSVAGTPVVTTTAPDGSFAVQFSVPDGPVDIELRYGGGARMDAARLAVSTDPAKQAVTLSFVKVRDVPAGAELRVDAATEDGPAMLAVQLAIAHVDALRTAAGGAARSGEAGPIDRDDWRPLPHVVTTGSPFVLARTDAGGPGSYRVRARFPGDSLHQPAELEQTLELGAMSSTTLRLRQTELAYEDELVASGRVVDQDDRPLGRAAVTLTLGAGDRRLAQGVTADDGTFAFHVEARLLTVGDRGPWQLDVQAQADPSTPAISASRSSPIRVTIASPHPVPVSYTIAAFIATVLAAGGFFAARSKPWLRFRRPGPPADAPQDADTTRAADQGGLVVAKPSVMSTLRRASDDGFSGVVRDSVRGRAVAEAVVRVLLGDHEREVRTATDGAFAIERLEPGEWHAEVAAPGHITERFVVSIPHRGELRGVRVDLVPVRERVFQLYRRAAEPVLPEPRLWGVWSPRQIVDHVRARRPSPALAELTDFVEEVYFSPRLAAETIVPTASERVDRAIQERVRFAAPGSPPQAGAGI